MVKNKISIYYKLLKLIKTYGLPSIRGSLINRWIIIHKIRFHFGKKERIRYNWITVWCINDKKKRLFYVFFEITNWFDKVDLYD